MDDSEWSRAVEDFIDAEFTRIVRESPTPYPILERDVFIFVNTYLMLRSLDGTSNDVAVANMTFHLAGMNHYRRDRNFREAVHRWIVGGPAGTIH